MADEYIRKAAALNASKITYIECLYEDEAGYLEGEADEIPVVFKRDIEAIPAADVVSRDCYDKILWEHDIMRRQLAEIGKVLGEKMDNVRPVVHGHWIWKHRHRGGFKKVSGVDAYGNEHTIIIDDRYETDDPYCSECGLLNDSSSLNFCPNCGADMREGEFDIGT